MNHLHPGARWLYRWYGIRMFFPIMIFIVFFIFASIRTVAFLDVIGAIIGLFGIIALLVIFGIIEIYARMSYNRYLYEVSHDGIKIERGIIWKKYTSIPYERVQNVDIQRGIIARMFGFSTVQIETAGQSGFRASRGNKEYKSEGYLPAIEIVGAEEMRAFVLKQIKHRHASSSGGV